MQLNSAPAARTVRPTHMRGLYAIVDTAALDQRDIDVVAFTEAVLEARPAALQLRDKSSEKNGIRRSVELLQRMAPLAHSCGVPLYANDRPDLAILTNCPGVHVGQQDLPVPLVRELAERMDGHLFVGVSTTNETQIRAAVADKADYIAIGPVYGTQSKTNPNPTLGVERLRELATFARSIGFFGPLVAIGGIGIEQAAMIGSIVDCVAVIGALVPSASGKAGLSEVTNRARALQQLIVSTSEKVSA